MCEDDGKKRRCVKLWITEKQHEQLKREAQARGCFGLSEYLRQLITSSPHRSTAEALEGTQIAAAERLFFMLFRLAERLESPSSFLGRILRDEASGVQARIQASL